MNLQFRLVAVATAALLLVPSYAAGKVKLSAMAKVLTGAEIKTAYSGHALNWTHPNTDKMTGTVVFDAAGATMTGTWSDGKSTGDWEGQATWKGDQYCWQARPKGSNKSWPKSVCNVIYLDGTTFYETDPKSKKILSVNEVAK